MRKLTVLIGMGLGAAMAGSASGALVAADTYRTGTDRASGEYALNQALSSTLHDNLVTPGFVNGRYASGSGTSNFIASDNGLQNATAGSTSAGSGKVNWISAPLDSINRSVARNLSAAPPASSTYWISHLVNRGDMPQAGGDGSVLTGFGNTTFPSAGATAAVLGGVYVGYAQDGVAGNFGNLVIRSRNEAANTAADTVLVNGATSSTFGNTYLVVMKVDVNVNGGSTDAISWWLNPTNATSEATLADTAAGSGSFTSFAVGSGSDFARLNYAARNWNGTAFFDEPRLSTDLTGLNLAVPEPAGLALLGMAGLGLARRRKP